MTVASQPATSRERRAAAVLVCALCALTGLGFATLRSARPVVIPSFLAGYAGSTGMADAIAAGLLFTLYRFERRRSILFTALAYGLNAVLIVPYALTFPDVIAADAFIGSEQSAAFLWLTWHYTFAILVGFGNLGAWSEEAFDRRSDAVWLCGIVALFGAAITIVATAGAAALPHFVSHAQFDASFRALAIGASAANLTAALLVARTPALSTLRLWLIVALVASTLDTLLNGFAPARFTPSWLVGKGEQFVTASAVLFSIFGAWSSGQERARQLADRVANMIVQRRALQDDFEREHRASQAFQQAALPSMLPIVPGLAFDALYRAADHDVMVGGDWYDAFRIDDGRLVVSVGDVMGTGLYAAVTMNAVRQSIRGAAQLFPDPIAILNAADRALRSERPGSIVTAFVAVIDPITLLLSYASAGHPPAILRMPGGLTRALEGSGLPLGIRSMLADGEREEAATVELPDPSMLVLYTDGLTEASRDVVAGEASLLKFVAGEEVMRVADPATAIADALIDKPLDDVAIVTVLVDGTLREHAIELDNGIRWTFPSSAGDRAAEVRGEIFETLVAMGANEYDLANAGLILSELVGNVYRHARGDVSVVLDTSAPSPVLHVLDRGSGFRFVSRLPTSTFSESGRGLFVVSQIAYDFSVGGRPGGGSHARAVLPFQPTVRTT